MLENDLRTRLGKLVQQFISRPSREPFFAGSVAAAASDNLVDGREFIPEASYFSVRMVEMRLAEGGRYFTEFLPLAVCVAEYTYGAERRRVPLVLSNEKVRQMLGDAGGDPGHVQFTNIPLVSRAPVKADDLALFVGLFQMPYSDLARAMLQLAGDVSEELGGAALGTGVKAASKLYDSITTVFGLKDVNARFAFLNGMALEKSRYMLVTGAPEHQVRPADYVVKGGRLMPRQGTGSGPEGIDYCLLAIEQPDTLFPARDAKPDAAALRDLAALPFHKFWTATSSLLAKKQPADAEAALLLLRAEVIASPDLTEDDRLIAIAGYDAAFAKYGVALGQTSAAAPTTRGFRSGTPSTGLRAVADRRERQGDKAGAAAIKAIATNIQVPGATTPSADNADQILAEAVFSLRRPMAEARKQGVRAATIADAIAIGTFRDVAE